MQELLEVRACQPKVPTLTEIKAADALREATFDARSQGVLGFEFGGLLPLAGGLDGLVVRLRPDGELPWGVFRHGAHTTGGARATGGPVETDTDDRITRDIVSRPPVDTCMPLRTVGLLRLPIQDKGLHAIALTGLWVLVRVGWGARRWPSQVRLRPRALWRRGRQSGRGADRQREFC
jgi:hypothetical protein